MRPEIETFLNHPRAPWLLPLSALLYALITIVPILENVLPLTTTHVKDTISASVSPGKLTHIFGKYALRPDSAPETTLPWVLEGTVAGHSAVGHFALIKVPGAETKLFRINDTITESVQLLNVLPDCIIIQNHGQKETLRLPKLK